MFTIIIHCLKYSNVLSVHLFALPLNTKSMRKGVTTSSKMQHESGTEQRCMLGLVSEQLKYWFSCQSR